MRDFVRFVVSALILLVGAPVLAQEQLVETFSGQLQIQFFLPGNPLPGGQIEFGYQTQFTALDFAPGSVMFQGQPVDFDGTEANFLVPNLVDGLMLLGGPPLPQPNPLRVGGLGPLDMNGPANAPGEGRAAGLDLGPAFTQNFFDLQGGDNLSWTFPLWQSAVIPQLDPPAYLTFSMDLNLQFVDPLLGIVVADVTGIVLADPPPLIQNIVISQIDFLDDNLVMVIPDSSWGLIEFDFLPHLTTPFYLNLVGDIGNGEAWLIQNLPLFPEFDRLPAPLGIDLNLLDLGLPLGDPMPPLDFGMHLGLQPLPVPPALAGLELMTQAVIDLPRVAFGSQLPGGPPTPPGDTRPAGVKTDKPYFEGIFHDDVPEVQEHDDACLPGAFARSIGWMNTTYNLGIPKTAQQIYDDLRALSVGAGLPTSTTYEDSVKKKANYLKTNSGGRGVTKVLDLDNVIGPIDGVKEETGIDLIEYLKREFPTSDCELHYDTHIVTLTSLYRGDDGRYFVTYRDDKEQGNAAGDRSERYAELRKNPDGSYSFRDSRQDTFWKVRAVVTESVPPKLQVGKNPLGEATFGWDDMGPNATNDLVGGSLDQLRATGGDFGASTQCLRSKLVLPPDPFGGPLLPPPAPGEAQFFMHRNVIKGKAGTYDSRGAGQGPGRDPQLTAPPTGCPVCEHSVCTVGEPITDPFCDAENPSMGVPDGCVGQVCSVYPSCCQFTWDLFCVEQARQICGQCN